MKLIDLIGELGYITEWLTDWEVIKLYRLPRGSYKGVVLYINLNEVCKVSAIEQGMSLFNAGYGISSLFFQTTSQVNPDNMYRIKGKVYLSSGRVIPIKSKQSFTKKELLKYMHSQEVPYSLKLNEINVFN